jgi:transmembrane sensor
VEEDIGGLRLTRYISGQCTAEEAAAIRRWIAADPSRAHLVTELEAAWRFGGQAPYEWGVEEGWRRFDAARRARNRPSFRLIQGAKRAAPSIVMRDSGTPIWRIAAAVFVIAGASLAVWRAGAPRARARAAANANAMTEVATLRGQRATLRLADGTRVALGMASRLRYARAFGDSARDVYLDGDGYFEVAHDSLHPFAVHTSTSVIRDVGTKFGVRAYSQSAETEVIVAEGAVAFTAPKTGEALVLRARDLVRLEGDGRSTTLINDVDPKEYLAWTEGRLAFQDTPLREVIAELHRWYDRDLLQLADTSIGSRRLTASFTNESLPIVIDRIALSLDLREERHGQTVVLHPRHH